jgi:hypothetical protein
VIPRRLIKLACKIFSGVWCFCVVLLFVMIKDGIIYSQWSMCVSVDIKIDVPRMIKRKGAMWLYPYFLTAHYYFILEFRSWII